MREVFNALRYIVRIGESWRMMLHDLPPWFRFYQESQRWIAARVFEAMVDDLRPLLRLASGHKEELSAVIMDGRVMQSSPESGGVSKKTGELHTACFLFRVSLNHPAWIPL